jgi:1,2-diacylglycerol 3-alpha-glucosyltransferase
MRIIIAGQTYYPITNGQAVFTYRLAEGLAKLGHQVMVVTPSDRFFASRTKRNGVIVKGITAIPLLPLYAEVYMTFLPNPQVKRLLKDFQPDVVHIQDHYPLCLSVSRIARRIGIPLIGTNHFLPQNIIPYVPVMSKFRSGRRFLEGILWKMMFKTFNQLDIVTTPTETAARILYQQGFHKQIYSISCGIDLNRFQNHNNGNVDQIRQRYGLDPNRVIFLYVGRVDREKRLEVLIEAFHRLNRDDIQLIIAGKGLNLQHLKKLTEQLQLKDRVIFTGFVPQGDLPILLSIADVFSMPSDVELQSIATLEALAVGKPVLAADARALPELVKNGTNGFLFKANDVEDASRCIAWMADQPNQLARMGKASLEIVKNHDIMITIKRYLDLYRSAINGSEES